MAHLLGIEVPAYFSRFQSLRPEVGHPSTLGFDESLRCDSIWVILCETLRERWICPSSWNCFALAESLDSVVYYS